MQDGSRGVGGKNFSCGATTGSHPKKNIISTAVPKGVTTWASTGGKDAKRGARAERRAMGGRAREEISF